MKEGEWGLVRCRVPLPLARRRMRVRDSPCQVWRIRTGRIRRSTVSRIRLSIRLRLRARPQCRRSTGGMPVRYLLSMLSRNRSRRIRFCRILFSHIRFSRPSPIPSLLPVGFPIPLTTMVGDEFILRSHIRHNPVQRRTIGTSQVKAVTHGEPQRATRRERRHRCLIRIKMRTKT